MTARNSRAWALHAVAWLLPALAIAAVWYFGDLGTFRSAEEVERAVQAFAQRQLGFVWVPLAFALGTVLFIPVTALIVGTALAFEPWVGISYALVGSLLGAAFAYGAGRLLGSKIIDRISGPRLAKLARQLRAHAFRSTLLVRLVPIGGFTVVNLLAGSLRVPFGGFLLGNLVGLLPGLLLVTFLSGHLPEVIRSPTVFNLGVLTLVVLALLRAGWALRRWVQRRAREDAAA